MDVYAATFDITPAIFPPAAFADLGQLMTNIIRLLIIIAAILSIVYIIVAGFKFITASGDEKALASAKGTLTYVIIGLIALILVFVILQVIQFFLKTDTGIF